MTIRTTTVPLPEPLARWVTRPLRRAGWLAGLPVLALVWVIATLQAGPTVAARIRAEGAAIAAGTTSAAGEPWLRLDVRGRDLLAAGEAPDVGERQAVLERLAALDGPRRIVSSVGLVETASPFQWAATRTISGRVALEGSRPAEIGRRALEVAVTGALGPGTRLDDEARAARGAPPDFSRAAAFLAARLTGLAPGARVALSDTVLSLSGDALDMPAYDALRAALADPPDGFSLGRVEILPPRVDGYRFAIEKSAAGVRLDGFVGSEALRESARAAAVDAAAGGPVDDRLSTARGLAAGIDPRDLAAFAFRLAGLIQSGTVAFADGAVSVTGDAVDRQAIPEAAALMRDGRPAGVRAGAVTLAERPLSPYRVRIRRTAEAVTLTGHLPDAETRERVMASLRSRLFREPLLDRTRTADGAPSGLAAALAAAAPLLMGLATGEVASSDRSLALTGESLYRESAARAPDALRAVLPDGWSGRAAVTPRQPTGQRDPEVCRAALTAATAGVDLRFPTGSAIPMPEFYPVLDALAALTKACPTLRIAISAPADPVGPASQHDAAPGTAPARADMTPGAKPEGVRSPGRSEAAKARPQATVRPDIAAGGDPPSDLPRQRAQALMDYLQQAGARPDQVGSGPGEPVSRVVFAPSP